MAFPGENLVIRMWESLVDKGIGAFLQPWQARRVARAELENRRDEILMLAQAESEAKEIRSGAKKLHQAGHVLQLIDQSAEVVDGRVEPQLNMPRALAIASGASAAQAVLDEVNVSRAVLHAEKILLDQSVSTSDAAVDADWLRAWRDGASRVSTDDLQSLWGKVLASEFMAPGSCSLRAIDFIKNLSREEASAIEQVCPYVLNGKLIPKYGVVELANEPFRYESVLFLEELGLLNTGGGGLRTTHKPPGPIGLNMVFASFTKRALLVKATSPEHALELNVFRVTPLGTQIFALGGGSADDDYLRDVGRACLQQGFSVEIGNLDDTSQDGIVWRNGVAVHL